MGYGGFFPYPKRYGGGRPLLRIVQDALGAARGTALDATQTVGSTVWVETHAYARAITFDGYGTNAKVGYQWDPLRMSDFIPRWERIFRIIPSPASSLAQRRTVIYQRFRRFLEATALHARLYARLVQDLGSTFVAIEYIDPTAATIYVPDASYPWGTVNANHPWFSTVCHILVLLQKPPGYSEGDFYAAASRVVTLADGLLPSYVTIDWYRAPSAGPPIAVSGGPSSAGFYLDADANLDNSVFDV